VGETAAGSGGNAANIMHEQRLLPSRSSLSVCVCRWVSVRLHVEPSHERIEQGRVSRHCMFFCVSGENVSSSFLFYLYRKTIARQVSFTLSVRNDQMVPPFDFDTVRCGAGVTCGVNGGEGNVLQTPCWECLTRNGLSPGREEECTASYVPLPCFEFLLFFHVCKVPNEVRVC